MWYRSVGPFDRIVMFYLYSASLTKMGTGLTVLIDTYFWKTEYPLWPELFAVYFNVVQGKSADWGVRPSSFSLLIPHPRLPPILDLPTANIPHHAPPKTPPLILPPGPPRSPHRRAPPLPIVAHHDVYRNHEYVGT